MFVTNCIFTRRHLQLLIALAMVAVVYAGEETAQIISQDVDISPEGQYQYAFETDNGINVKEQGAQKEVGEEKSSVSNRRRFIIVFFLKI